MAKPKPRSFLDTNVLIKSWTFPGAPKTIEQARTRALSLIDLHRTPYITSPARIEFLCGVRNENERKLKETFLAQFQLLDQGNIPSADWVEAARFAKRFGDRIRIRKLGDCLMKAISLRFKCDIVTLDRDFKNRIPPEPN